MAFYVKILHIFFMLKEIKPTFSVAIKQDNTKIIPKEIRPRLWYNISHEVQ